MHHPPCTCHACGEKPSRPCPPPCPPPAPDCGCRPSPPCPPPCPPPAPDCGCRPHRPCPPPCPPPAPDCGCRPSRPCKPCKPGKPEGVLLQKILSCDRLSISCLCVDLALSGLDCARPPLTLMSVHESGAQPSWTPLGEPDCAGRVMVRVTVPVCAQVSDACGQRFAATGQADAEVCLRLPGACHGYYSLFLLPCVRLLCADGCAEGPVFHARLQVVLDAYAVRPEPCMLRRREPACPDLPLYPPPITPGPPCWPQCPAGPDPCGWPARG